MKEIFNIVLFWKGSDYSLEPDEPFTPISYLLEMIITELKIPKPDGSGNPYIFHLGKIGADEEVILHPKIKGEEKNLIDYGVKAGDRLTLTTEPNAA